ncbi:hypothetical protein KIW84_011997 [Lathyrus oleraceus]|uniref:Uncharacterized protein n=1 Tax=Pisum sativum TaxID=3888 RepID=A0A9D5BGI0_PEA|nr:hypothetical protein KIW84_011997 [Pisum sativum]
MSRSNLKSDDPPDLIDNNLVTSLYDFDHPIYHAKEEGEEDCDLLGLARLSKQEEKVTQPHEERVKIVIPGCSPTETVYAGSYHFVNFQNGSDQYTAQKAIKGSVLYDHLARQPIGDYQPRKSEFPDEDISRYSNQKIESDRSRRRGLTLNPNGF